MDNADKVHVPVLKDVIIQGNTIADAVMVSTDLLDADQATLLSQQIEAIIQDKLQAALTQAVEDIKAHLDDVLPLLVEQALNPVDTNNEDSQTLLVTKNQKQ